MKQIILAFIIVLCFFQTAYPQERDTLLLKKLIKHGLSDTKEYALSPFNWDKKNWLLAGGISVTTGALITWGDKAFYNFSNSQHTKARDVFFKYAEPMGNIYPVMAVSAVFIKGIVNKENYSVETSMIAAESMILTTAMVQLVKNTACRTRPNNEATTNPHQWQGPFFKGNSFYSGHTTTAFAAASVFAYRYRHTKWVPIVSYSLATIGGLQRIYNNRHWASDVFMGAVMGSATGVFLCKQWENNSIKFYPSLGINGAGLSLVIPIE